METTFVSPFVFFITVFVTTISTAVAAYYIMKYRALVENNRALERHRDIDMIYRHIDDMIEDLRRDMHDMYEEIHREAAAIQSTVPCLTPKEIAVVRGLAGDDYCKDFVDDDEVEA